MASELVIPELAEPAPATAEALSRMADLREILELALHAGHLLLENGAETWRVEETVNRLGVGLGAEWMEVYPTPTGIIVSAVASGEHRTRIRRVPNLGVDLSRVGDILMLSRQVTAGQAGRSEVRAGLAHITQMPRAYAAWVTVLMVACASACFAALSGAGLAEFALGGLAAAITLLARNGLNRFFGRPVLLTTAVSALIGASAATIGMYWVTCSRPDLVILASIISLIPGIPMVNSVNDLINANYVSGLARGAQAALHLAAIATGMVVALALFGGGWVL